MISQDVIDETLGHLAAHVGTYMRKAQRKMKGVSCEHVNAVFMMGDTFLSYIGKCLARDVVHDGVTLLPLMVPSDSFMQARAALNSVVAHRARFQEIGTHAHHDRNSAMHSTVQNSYDRIQEGQLKTSKTKRGASTIYLDSLVAHPGAIPPPPTSALFAVIAVPQCGTFDPWEGKTFPKNSKSDTGLSSSAVWKNFKPFAVQPACRDSEQRAVSTRGDCEAMPPSAWDKVHNRFHAYRVRNLRPLNDVVDECTPSVEDIARQSMCCSDNSGRSAAFNSYVELMFEKFSEHLKAAFGLLRDRFDTEDRRRMLIKVQSGRNVLWNRMCDRFNCGTYDPRYCPTL